ncbi:hypothetical protein SETIT_3G092500v2 [Setaria italica]|uniref:Helitron helicase-like domain-containing protein n=1 Tax=Setaria italica TaxID=4555 RepID=A0A368QD04_SETIT|nr:hypothetical protein SETIT_3G092500v2 [Setaria italica]
MRAGAASARPRQRAPGAASHRASVVGARRASACGAAEATCRARRSGAAKRVICRKYSPAESQSQVIDANEKRRKRDRERYAKITDEEKHDKLKKQHEAYHRRKGRDATQYQKKYTKERQKYANMQLEQKKARIEQAITNREMRSSKTTKGSIAIENPAYIETNMLVEVNTSSLNVKHRKHVTPGERQTLLARQNKKIIKKQKGTVYSSSEEDETMSEEDNDIEMQKQAKIMNLDPKHLELYFYDDDPSLEHQYRCCREEKYKQDKHFRSLGQNEKLDDYRLILNLDQRLDQKPYNAPITLEVAVVWIKGNERRNTFDKNVILHGNNNEIQGIKSYYGCYDPLSYPLFFPRAELDSSSKLWVTMREYYCYKFHARPSIFNPILHGGRLFQQLDFIWHHQKEIRADLYKGLLDSIQEGEQKGDKVGKRTVLASSFIGGPRDKLRRYLDAMALVSKYGKPDIFLTMTCNPNWEEITRELESRG